MGSYKIAVAALVILSCCSLQASEHCALQAIHRQIVDQASPESANFVVFRGEVSSLPPPRNSNQPVLTLSAVYFDYAVTEVLWGHLQGAVVHAPYISEPPCGLPELVLHAQIVTFCSVQTSALEYCLNPVPASEVNLKSIREWIHQAEQHRQTISISAQQAQAHLIYAVKPEYPSLGRQVRVQGDVVLKIMIDWQGRVERAEVLSGHPLLLQASIDAVRQWRYKPFLLAGTPVRAETTATVHFKL